jgi:single-stranded-DNA-specific exonuclease
MSETVWILPRLNKDVSVLSKEGGIPVSLARILINRDINNWQKAHNFFYGTLDDLHDPYLMDGMQDAVERIGKAASNREKVIIFGDYDVDGILSVVILIRALESLGIDVDYYIPDRLKDGYGIKPEYIRIVKQREASLAISVDCGIKALEFVREAEKIGVDVIITDHHQPGEILPEALAVLNPAVSSSGYPDKNLAGIGVVFKLIQAILKKEGKASVLPHYLKLVSIGTIADIVELQNENRILVKFGLKALENVANKGLKSLLEVCGLKGNKVNTGDVGFRIGPRINAAGRLGKAELSVKLFFSDSVEESKNLALRLDGLNAERQVVEKKTLKQAMCRVEDKLLHERYKLLILGCEEWHRGVIGIVASRLKESFNRPVILFVYKDGIAYGSGRSIKEFSLINCLQQVENSLLNFGGHPMAVGCELSCDKMDSFKQAVNIYADNMIQPEDLRKKIHIDTKINFNDIDAKFLDMLSLLSPFGMGNPRPVFLTENVEIVAEPIKIKRRHIKALVRNDGIVFEAIGWGKGDWKDRLFKGDRISIVYSLNFSEYLGAERLYLNMEDIKPVPA